MGGVGGAVGFLPFTKKIKKATLKILNFAKLVIADAPVKKIQQILFYPRAEHFWDSQNKNI